MNTFKKYEDAATETDMVFQNSTELWYVALGISGEVGEIVGHIKKSYRDDHRLTAERRILILKECGDVLWYLSKTARILGSSLAEVADMNIAKLKARAMKKTLHGSGDNR